MVITVIEEDTNAVVIFLTKQGKKNKLNICIISLKEKGSVDVNRWRVSRNSLILPLLSKIIDSLK